MNLTEHRLGDSLGDLLSANWAVPNTHAALLASVQVTAVEHDVLVLAHANTALISAIILEDGDIGGGIALHSRRSIVRVNSFEFARIG